MPTERFAEGTTNPLAPTVPETSVLVVRVMEKAAVESDPGSMTRPSSRRELIY